MVEVVDAIERRWPTVVNAGIVDRRALAEIVFDDRSELDALESITHPHIFGRILDEVSRIEGPVVVEVPLIEHRLGDDWTTVVVDVRTPERIERLLARGMDEADARSRISSQPSRMEWLAAGDLVVPNNGSIEELSHVVDSLLSQLLPQNLSQ